MNLASFFDGLISFNKILRNLGLVGSPVPVLSLLRALDHGYLRVDRGVFTVTPRYVWDDRPTSLVVTIDLPPMERDDNLTLTLSRRSLWVEARPGPKYRPSHLYVRQPQTDPSACPRWDLIGLSDRVPNVTLRAKIELPPIEDGSSIGYDAHHATVDRTERSVRVTIPKNGLVVLRAEAPSPSPSEDTPYTPIVGAYAAIGTARAVVCWIDRVYDTAARLNIDLRQSPPPSSEPVVMVISSDGRMIAQGSDKPVDRTPVEQFRSLARAMHAALEAYRDTLLPGSVPPEIDALICDFPVQ